MEVIEVSDQSFLQMGQTTTFGGHNFILQGYNPNPIEVVEEIPTSLHAGSSIVQMVDPNPVVSYIVGPDGALIPVYDSIPFDNTVTIVTGADEPDIETRIPSHMLDHMYARKMKEPGTTSPAKPRRRAKKKEPPPPAVMNEFSLPEIISPSTPKVNIIRKGVTANLPPALFRSLISSSRPKILQNKAGAQASHGSGHSATSDLPFSQSSAGASPPPDKGIPTETSSMYFLPSNVESGDSDGSTVVSKPSFVVATSPPKTDYAVSGSPFTDGVRSFHVNSDGTLSADAAMVTYSISANEQQQQHQVDVVHLSQTEVHNTEFPVCTFSEEKVVVAEAGVKRQRNRGSFKYGDKQFFFTYV